jgi:hypothetical protein
MNNKISFEDLPDSAYSPHTYRFFLHILSIRTDSFRVFSVYVENHSDSENAPKEFPIFGIELFPLHFLKGYYSTSKKVCMNAIGPKTSKE